MSRYGPTVLPEPNYNFANALAGLQSGYTFGSDILAQRRQRQQQEEEFEAQKREGQLGEALAQEQARRQGVVPTPARPPARLGPDAQGRWPAIDLTADLPTVRTPQIDMQHPEAVTDTGLWPSQRQRQIPLGRTGYAYDPDVAKAAEEESLGYYLRRQTPAWNQRAQLEQDKEKAALQRTTVQQTGQTDRERERNARLAAAAAAADATRRQIAATTDATRRQIATTPRPRAAGVAGERDLAGWQRTLAQAQSALRDAEMGGTLGKARDEPGTEPDRAAYKDDAAYRVANGAYLRQVRRYHDRRTEVQQAQDQVRDAQQHVSQLQSGGGAAPANGGRKQQITSDQRDYLRSQGHPDAWINARYVVR